jgi:hypothetical protein
MIDRVFKTNLSRYGVGVNTPPSPKPKKVVTTSTKKAKGRKWTPEQRRKFKASMKEVWKRKQATKK